MTFDELETRAEASVSGSEPDGYAQWLADIKQRVAAAQQRAALAVNAELIALYWQIGHDILERQSALAWGSKVLDRISHDLRTAFPEMRGFSRTNLKYMRLFAQAWSEASIGQQAVGQLPWGHNIVLLTRIKSPADRLAYAEAALANGWSRSVLVTQIDRRVLQRQGQAVTNFARTIPQPDSDLAREALKDPYKFDFLELGAEAQERAIEQALVDHVADFLVELGTGFAYLGRQVHLEVDGTDFFIDLLFYHVKLHRYVVIELKATEFKPEHIGQLNFYLTTVDHEIKSDQDGPTIGLLLCQSKNGLVAEYAIQDINKPMGIAEYELMQSLPEPLRTNLPSIEEIERELGPEL